MGLITFDHIRFFFIGLVQSKCSISFINLISLFDNLLYTFLYRSRLCQYIDQFKGIKSISLLYKMHKVHQPTVMIIDLDAEQANNSLIKSNNSKKQLICKPYALKVKSKNQITKSIPKNKIQSKELLLYTFPHKNINNIVKLLLQNDIKSKQDRQNSILQLKRIITDSPQKVKNCLTQIDTNLKGIGEITKGCGIIKCFPIEARQIRFKFDPLHDRFDDKKIVAIALCKKDYGISSFKQQLEQNKKSEQFNINSYKTCCYSVVTEVYRRLQRFLQQQCKKKINPIDRFQMRSIFTILLNCKKYLDSDSAETFCKFTKLVYGIQNVTINQQQAKILYLKIQQVFILRLINKKSYITTKSHQNIKQNHSNYQMKNCVYTLDKIWNQTYERDLITVYHHHIDFKDVRQYFREMYPKQSELFTIDALRSKFYKIIRLSLKRLLHISCKQELPNLIKLNELKIKYILRSIDAYAIRLLLIDFYIQKQADPKMVYLIIVKINEYTTMKDKERLSNQQQNCSETRLQQGTNEFKQKDSSIRQESNTSFEHMHKLQQIMRNYSNCKIKKYPSIKETLKRPL